MPSSFNMYQAGYTLVPNQLLERYGQLKLTAQEFVLITYLLNNANPDQGGFDFQKVTPQLGWTMDQLFEVINSLSNKNYLSIDLVQGPDGKQSDYYSLKPLFDQLSKTSKVATAQPEDTRATSDTHHQAQIRQLIADFEQEFSRGLSGMEIEMLNQWIRQDRYDLALIRIALREAVIHNAINIKYIDTILLNWQKENIQTANEAERAIQARRQRQSGTSGRLSPAQKPRQDYPEIPLPGFD